MIPIEKIVRKKMGDWSMTEQVNVDIYLDNGDSTYEHILIGNSTLLKHYICDEYGCIIRDFGDACIQYNFIKM
jgi:hypothetical protein